MTILRLSKLSYALLAAGLPVAGVDINGRVTWVTSPTPAQESQAASIVAAHDDSTPLGYVSCLAAGAKLIGIIQAAGGRWFPERYRIIVVQAVAVTTPPTISIGTNGPDYNNIAPATALGSIGLNSTADMRNVFISATTRVITSNLPIYVNVTVAAIAGQFVIRADFIGDFEDKEQIGEV